MSYKLNESDIIELIIQEFLGDSGYEGKIDDIDQVLNYVDLDEKTECNMLSR